MKALREKGLNLKPNKINKLMRIIYVLSILTLMIGFTSCDPNNNESSETSDLGQILADTIIYEVKIANSDSLNQWENEKVKYVNNEKIVNTLFDLIYNKGKVAYNYYTNEALSKSEVKDIEKQDGYNRKYITKLQFTEAWYYDETTLNYNKKILGILLAIELYNEDGEIRGYKALFTVKM